MKKNISINIFGQIYKIDEDAYQLLSDYLDSMRRYFAGKDGGSEIADDVEQRVSELFSEIVASGRQAIAIEDVQDVVKRIGNPQQLNSEEPDGEAGEASKPKPRKALRRLYRDPDDRILGGVVAGMCHYLGISNPLPVRIGVVLLFFLSYSVALVVYLVLWAVLPSATTPEQKLEMRGEPVNPATIADEAVKIAQRGSEAVRQAANRTDASGCLAAMLRLLAVCVKAFVALVLIVLMMAAFVCFIATLAYCVLGVDVAMYDDNPQLMSLLLGRRGAMWLTLIVTFIATTVSAMPLYLILRGLIGGRGSRPMSAAARMAWLAVWLLLTAVLCASGVILAHSYKDSVEAQERRDNTHNGIYLSGESWDFIADTGWKISAMKNVDPDLVTHDDNPLTGEYESYLDISRDDWDGTPPLFNLSTTRWLAKGAYRMSIVYRVDDTKAVGFALTSLTDSLVLASGLLKAAGREGFFSNYDYASASSCPLLAAGVADTAWNSVCQKADEQKWRYAEARFDVPRGAEVALKISQQRQSVASGRATSRLSILAVDFTELNTPVSNEAIVKK